MFTGLRRASPSWELTHYTQCWNLIPKLKLDSSKVLHSASETRVAMQVYYSRIAYPLPSSDSVHPPKLDEPLSVLMPKPAKL